MCVNMLWHVPSKTVVLTGVFDPTATLFASTSRCKYITNVFFELLAFPHVI